jgi:SNF2 family DNA or RNA helicase
VITRRAYTPRPYAAKAMDLFASTPRCALFAKPGMGKTPMVLTFLAFKYDVWGESAPTLVVGPKRVAEHVWPDEVKKWDHLASLDVVCITGTAAERAAALRLDAPIYTIAYDNLVWLREHFKRSGRAWPFRTVIADESTRLKNFRISQGGARARAIGEFAHAEVDTWINLTGTPAPNGLKDLWGQTWFLDAGARLGRSYSSFESRWFGYKRIKDALTHKVGIQPVIFEHAHHQIHERLADICLTLDPKDWFDLAEPVVNVIEVDLPRRAAELYKQFERELFMELDGNEIEVFNAAAKTIKCLQLANGAVYLEDGKEWVGVHDEKLDALESLVEENAGEPVLCAYHFKSDLARLKARFPDALDLSVDAQMLAAKAGQGRLWLGHPAGMGHGVDGLQEHCATLAFFGHWWDLEQHDQFIERVGPMRQYQAGKDRAVSIHYIVARGTIDQVVVERRKSKGAVQDLLLDYMKGKL